MNSILFMGPSGSPVSALHSSLFVIEPLEVPGNTSGANHIGFFGAGGPGGVPFAVVVDQYQDLTFITNTSGVNLGNPPFGVPGSGKLNNFKFQTTTTANVSGVAGVQLTDIPQNSGTILIRLIPSGSPAPEVQTQNAIVRTVALNASSGVDDVTDIVTGVKVQMFEPAADSSWTQTAGVGALDNRLFLQDHNDADTVHDFFVAISVSPEAVGERDNFGTFAVIEFL